MNGTSEIKEDIKKKPSRNLRPEWKYIIPAAALVLIIAALVFIYFMQEQKPDLASEKIIREAAARQLSKDPNELTDEDFAKITELSLSSEDTIKSEYLELTNIKIITKFANLQVLKLKDVWYPESAVPKWKMFLAKHDIHLESNKKMYTLDLTPLEKLVYLRELQLEGYSIYNIQPLAELKSLVKLELSCHCSNIEPLKGLKNLQNLSLCVPRVYDIEPIKSLKNLKTLKMIKCDNITDKQVDDLQKALPNLKIER